MGFYKQRENFLRTLAENDPEVQHNKPVVTEENTRRQSFFRINDEQELLAACENWVHTPCVVQFSLSGGDVNRDGSIRQRNSNTWLFLTKIDLDPSNPIEADAISNAYDQTFEILQRFKKAVYDEFEENDSCGVFKDIDPANFKWDQYGPVADQLYGWLLSFSDETKAIY